MLVRRNRQNRVQPSAPTPPETPAETAIPEVPTLEERVEAAVRPTRRRRRAATKEATAEYRARRTRARAELARLSAGPVPNAHAVRIMKRIRNRGGRNSATRYLTGR